MPTKKPCIFCKGTHWSFVCYDTKYNTLEKRKKFFKDNNLCLTSNQDQHEGCMYLDTCTCRWPHCRSRNTHNSTLCPSAPYPLTLETYKQWKKVVLDLIEKSKAAKKQGNDLNSSQKKGKPFTQLLTPNKLFQDVRLFVSGDGLH